METVLGLDLGTNSIGWAVIIRDGDDAPSRLDAGVYVFPDAGEIDSGLFVSDRLKRGNVRRQRVQLHRKRQRMRHVLELLIRNGLLPENPTERERYMSQDYKDGQRPFHPFSLRKRGLDEKLTLWEFGRCLHHIARRRGYFSTRDLMRRSMEEKMGLRFSTSPNLEEQTDEDEKPDRETSHLLKRLREVRERISHGEARTIGEFCADRLADPGAFPDGVRAKGKRKEGDKIKPAVIGWRADRLMHEDEFNRLWEAQAPYHPKVLTPGLRSALWEAIFNQAPLASKRGLIGTCEFFPKRKRLARASLLAQRCSILQTLNNLQITPSDRDGGRLTADQVCRLADELEKVDHLTWQQAKDLLGLPGAKFSDEPASAGRGGQKATRGHKEFRGNVTSAAMRGAIGSRWNMLCHEQQEELVDRFLYCRHLGDIVKGLRKDFGLSDDEIRSIACATLPSGYSNHCTRVWKTLEPLLRDGLHYDEACVIAGFRAPGESTVTKPAVVLDHLGGLPDLRSPRVQRSAKMAFRVINAVLDKYGKPDRIRIEMPRDVAMTNKQRERIYEQQDSNARSNTAAAELLKNNNLPDTEGNCTKVRLWWEAEGRSPYDPDHPVGLQELIDQYDIEHIVPRSRCWDGSWMNLTICSRGQNLEKGSQTPYEWLYGPRWDRVSQYVASLKQMPKPKRDRLLKKEWEKDSFTNRALSDTRYLSVVVKREVEKLGIPVDVSRGQMTAMLRKAWGLEGCLPITEEQKKKLHDWRMKPVKRTEKPRNDHRHHAIDAIVTALVDTRTLQQMSTWFKQRERGIARAELTRPKPWAAFTEDIKTLMDRVPVVHAPTRTVSGAINKDTAKKPPEVAAIQQALAMLPPNRRNRVRHAVVVGTQLVYLAPDGTPLAAYDLGSNHHAIVWERVAPDKSGAYPREITVTSMLEAALRATAREPVIQKQRNGWRYLMALCKNDIVEWSGDDPGLRRVTAISVNGDRYEIQLLSLYDAEKDIHRTCRVRGKGDLARIARRVTLNPLGDVIASEPPHADC